MTPNTKTFSYYEAHPYCGGGCSRFSKTVDIIDILREDANTITVREDSPFGDEIEIEYVTDASEFIRRQKILFDKNLQELKESHAKTIAMAKALELNWLD